MKGIVTGVGCGPALDADGEIKVIEVFLQFENGEHAIVVFQEIAFDEVAAGLEIGPPWHKTMTS